jgi:hypothetical protein
VSVSVIAARRKRFLRLAFMADFWFIAMDLWVFPSDFGSLTECLGDSDFRSHSVFLQKLLRKV